MKKTVLLFITSITLSQVLIDPNTLTAPNTPIIYATGEHGRIFISWDNAAQTSIDSATNYADFEGYRLYRSTDGGQTWGDDDDRMFDYADNFIGWRPYAEFDFNEEEDINHCIYSNTDCGNGLTRDTSYTGQDPYNPRYSLGENTGLANGFIDENVFDGIKYTYTVTAFDIGLHTYSIKYIDEDEDGIYLADTSWASSNPDHFVVDTLGNGYKSLESSMGTSMVESNFVTVIPGYNASNITFPDPEDIFSFMKPNIENAGNGNIAYFIVDKDNLTEGLIKFEINAWYPGNTVENMENEDPYVYVYSIIDSISQKATEVIPYDSTELTAGQIDTLLGLPGVELDGHIINVPDYKAIFEPTKGPRNFWSVVFDGIRVKFENLSPSLTDFGQDNSSIYELDWNADSSVINSLFFWLAYYDGTAYGLKPGFDYKVKFSNVTVDTTVRVAPGCFSSLRNAELPFKITNLSTNKPVGLALIDYGVDGEANFQNPDPGELDCYWTTNEEITFWEDSLLINDEIISKKTYSLFMYIDYSVAYPLLDTLWNSGISYNEGDRVIHEAMVWRASRNITESFTPQEFIDDNDDGINENPWKPSYPWNDGDEVVIRTKKWFEDGDSWIADMSLLGQSREVMQEDLETISVVPNPYIVSSMFNETADQRRLRFTHLPQQARIQIFTLFGERVVSLIHDNEFDGNLWWNLRSENNQEIAPGLYIYVVESGDKKHVGKFAVVR